MFQKACLLAQQFTRPIIISRKTVDGDCSATIGTFVVINKDGWFVTAHHILDELNKIMLETEQTQRIRLAYETIRDDSSLSRLDRKKAYKKLTKLSGDQVERNSAWWGQNELRLVEVMSVPEIDLAVGRLEPFDESRFANYPIFKDPTKGITPGKSLCKLGFPFHTVQPEWDDDNQRFNLPEGSLPLPLFPIEGIFTRIILIQVDKPTRPKIPLEYLETSSPGLRGQSGGPTFDDQGTIWAIQSRTAHYALGFSPKVPGSRNGETEHQFINVGLGIQSSALVALFDEIGLDYQVSDY